VGVLDVSDDLLWNYRCRPTRVVDGDTIYVQIDVGFRLTTAQSVRLLGVDTPEINRGTTEQRAAGVAAREATTLWLADHAVGDWPLRIATSKADSFGRWLGVVTSSDGDNLNEWLLEHGHAVPWV